MSDGYDHGVQECPAVGLEPIAPLDDTTQTPEPTRAANPIANYLLLGVGVAAAVGPVLLGTTIHG